jgi:hypothetical protein
VLELFDLPRQQIDLILIEGELQVSEGWHLTGGTGIVLLEDAVNRVLRAGPHGGAGPA